MSDDGEAWLRAGVAIFGRKEPDLRPFVEMLRGESPMPRGQRNMLASLLDPDGPGYLRFRLVLESMETKRDSHEIDITRKIPAVSEYNKLVSEGMSAQEAAVTVGEKFYVTDRTIFKWLEDVKDVFKSLKGKK